MIVSVDKHTLVEALESLASASASVPGNPMSEYFYMEVDSDLGVTLHSKSGIKYGRESLAASSTGEGSMLIPKSALKNIAKLAEEGTITLEPAEGNSIRVVAGEATLLLSSRPPKDFVTVSPRVDSAPTQCYQSPDVVESLKFLKAFSSESMKGKSCTLREGKWSSGTSSFLGSFYREDFSGEMDVPFSILPSLISFLSHLGPSPVIYAQTSNWSWWVSGDSTFGYQRGDTAPITVPSQVYDRVYGVHFNVSQSLLLSAMKRLMIVASSKDSSLSLHLSGSVEGSLILEVLNDFKKPSRERVGVRRSTNLGSEVSFKLDWKNLVSVLQSPPYNDSLLSFYVEPVSEGVEFGPSLKIEKADEKKAAIAFMALRD